MRRVPHRVITDEKVLQIYELSKLGSSNVDLAKKFNVSCSLVSFIRLGKTRHHLELAPLEKKKDSYPSRSLSVRQRILRWSRHNQLSGCWDWIGRLDHKGYGQITLNGKTRNAYRVSFESFVGEIKGRLLVCHKCDNPACVNPDHLFLGTYNDNMRDMVTKGRSARGERNFNAKISESDAIVVKSLLGKGVRSCDIAKSTGVSEAIVGHIRANRTWRHIQVNN